MHAAVAAHTIGKIAVQRFTRTGSAPAKPWFFDEALSGGIVMDQSIHDLDFARWNAGEVATVFARQSKADPAESLSVRSCQVVLTHVGGALSYVAGTWSRPGTTFRTTFEIAGSGGILYHDSHAHQAFTLDAATPDLSGAGLLPSTPHIESPYLTEIREIYAAFRGGPPPRVSAEDGYQAVRIAEAAAESLVAGRVIALGEQQVAE
jgi:myo-inositol 2-dehydrogenase/D-chiro-inositol 1-dehydrogenase